MPLRILLSPPELNYDSFGQKSQAFNIENHLAEELREFLNAYYPFNGENRRTQLLDGAWVSKKFKGGSGIQALHSQLKNVPIIVLESEVDNNYLNFRVAYWRGDGSEPSYSSILSAFPYRDFLYESAKDRAKKWAKTKQQLLSKGRTPERIKAIGGLNDFNLMLLQEEQQLIDDGIDLSELNISQEYKLDYKDYQKLHQYLITFHRITVSMVADIHYLTQENTLTPLLPNLLPELLHEIPESNDLQKTMLDWIVATYNEIYERLAEVMAGWIPELMMKFALALSDLEDKSHAKQQGIKSVRAWLKLRGIEDNNFESLQDVVTKEDEPYFKSLQEFLEKVEDDKDLAEIKTLLETWTDLSNSEAVQDSPQVKQKKEPQQEILDSHVQSFQEFLKKLDDDNDLDGSIPLFN